MRTDQAYTHTEELVLAVSLELAAAKWKVALHDGQREQPAVHTVAQPQAIARLEAVLDVIEQQELKWSLPADVRPVVSYEAGQDAFWIYGRCGHAVSSVIWSIPQAFRSSVTSGAPRQTGSMQSGW